MLALCLSKSDVISVKTIPFVRNVNATKWIKPMNGRIVRLETGDTADIARMRCSPRSSSVFSCFLSKQ